MSRFRQILRYAAFLCLIFLSTTTLSQAPANGLAEARVKPAAATENCTTGDCHASVLTHKVMHGPVATQKCMDCHKYEDATQHRFQPLHRSNQGCLHCHDMKNKSVVHEPVEHGSCTTCHDPHGSDYAWSLRAEPTKALCEMCHKRESDPKNPFVHTAITKGSCTDCHETHSADQPRLLKQEPRTLCTTCHKELLPTPGETLSVHAPARDDCIACHDPHASKLKYQLKQAAPQSCLSCHKNLEESLAVAPVLHGAMTAEKSCLACHVPHFSRLSKLQKDPQPQQCLGCHDRTLIRDDGRTITNMAALLKDNPEHHGPIRLGACTACHSPHAGSQDQLLSAAYPPEFYAPFSADRYQLCFTCHTDQLVMVPDASAPTGFKDANRNLHWLHVNQEKGRTCRACHEVHASRQPFHISASVPFGSGGWSMTLKYRRTPNGGTCEAGCHGERSYDHGDRPRSLSVVALTPQAQALVNPPAVEPMPPTTSPVAGAAPDSYPVPAPPFSPGVYPCTACHDPSVAANAQPRVLHKPHEDIQLQHDEEHRWCLDCHNAQNRDVLRSASGEPIPFAESHRLCGQCHGNQYRDWKTGVHGKRTGEWNGRKQYLLCVHCHDPHAPKFKAMTPLPPPDRPNSH